MHLCTIRFIGTDSTKRKDVQIAIPSKNARVKDLKNSISRDINIPLDQQKLFFGGKQLVDQRKLLDYGVQADQVIQLMICPVRNEDERTPTTEPEEIDSELVEGESLYYRIGDKIDYIDKQGAWFEAKVLRILKNPNLSIGEDRSIEEDLEGNVRFEIQMDRGEKTAPLIAKFTEIRPRSYHKLSLEELEVGMKVLVNYNITNPDQLGFWYDFEITRISKRLSGTIFAGDLGMEEECKIKSLNDVMRIENPVLITENLNLVPRQYERRALPLYCTRCRDNVNRRCKFCGCKVCSEKNNVSSMIICEECGFTYHLSCLDPPLSEIPSGDWYCPSCKTNEAEVVRPEDEQYLSESLEDENMEIPPEIAAVDVFGPIPGIRVGMTWKFRSQVVNEGLHRSLTASICFSETEGAYSIMLAGENSKDIDNGNEIYVNGQSFVEGDEIKSNGALFLNCSQEGAIAKSFFVDSDWRRGKPIRVMRSSLHKVLSRFAPSEGVRYDGIYKVKEFFPYYYGIGTAHPKVKVIRFLLRRDDPNPAPWAENSEKFEVIRPQDGAVSEPTHYNNLELPFIALDFSLPVKTYRFTCELYREHQRLRKMIKKDTSNEKLWNECLKTMDKFRNYRIFSKQIIKTFKCNSCLDLCWRPVTTRCGHNFCKTDQKMHLRHWTDISGSESEKKKNTYLNEKSTPYLECIVKSFKQFKLHSCPVCRFKFCKNEEFEINQVLKKILEKLFLIKE